MNGESKKLPQTEVILNLLRFHEEYLKIYNDRENYGILAVHEDGIHLSVEKFMDLFRTQETGVTLDWDPICKTINIEYEGVRFFCAL